MAATAEAAASERASPRTWWPAPMSSGTRAEPIQPEAPVMKMRMKGLLPESTRLMRFSRINPNMIMRLSRMTFFIMMRSGRVA